MFKNERFHKVIYLEHGGKGAKTGLDADNALPLVDGTLMAIEAGMVIEECFLVVDTALAGTTDLDVGDDDASNGYIDGSVSATLGTPGMYGKNAKVAGSYLRVQTAGATDAADIYVVPDSKYYSVGTKSLKLDVTGTSSAGKARVVVKGMKLTK